MRNSGPVTHARAVEAAIASDAAARSPLVASWSRSARLHGLDPDGRPPPDRMTSTELGVACERMAPILRAAGPSLDRLFQAVGGVGCCVLIADRDGVPLERRGSPGEDRMFADWGLWTGTRWSEAHEGTNGIGTCLAEHRAVTIHRDQHYLSRNTVLSCMSAPLHDAAGDLAGVLDVSSCRADLSEGFAMLIGQTVVDAARRIEAETFRAAFPQARIVLLPGADRMTGALLAVNADDLVIGATHGARVALGLSGDMTADPRPAADLLGQDAPDTIAAAETAVILRALARAGGNVSAAARGLGVSRATLHRRLGARPRPDLSQR